MSKFVTSGIDIAQFFLAGGLWYYVGVEYSPGVPAMAKKVSLAFFGDDLKTNLSERLKRVEGQVRGIERMLQENEPCPKLLQQLSATVAALNAVSAIVLRNYLESCVTAAVESGDGKRKEAVFDELVEVIKRFGQ